LSHHRHDVKVPHDDQDLDGLNYLEGRSLGNIQDRAFEGTLAAHVEVGHNDNVVLELERMDAYHLGYLFYFFERACAMSAYLNDVNPFNQPGVEIYKKNMFKLLGKPGYENK
jgi:glucose-6-phosphate isomerase